MGGQIGLISLLLLTLIYEEIEERGRYKGTCGGATQTEKRREEKRSGLGSDR